MTDLSPDAQAIVDAITALTCWVAVVAGIIAAGILTRRKD